MAKRGTILVIDSNPTSLEKNENYLKGQNFKVFACHPSVAVQTANEKSLDLVLITLHECDGIGIIGDIRKKSCNEKVGVICILPKNGNIEEVLQMEANDYLDEPYNCYPDLMRIVNKNINVKKDAEESAWRNIFPSFSY